MRGTHGILDLEWLLDYELRLAFRHRRYVAVVFMSADTAARRLDRLPDGAVRASDEFFVFYPSGTAALLMGETDGPGAVKAVERLKRVGLVQSDLCFAVSSYPQDGKSACEILVTAHRRLDLAQEQGPGSVVWGEEAVKQSTCASGEAALNQNAVGM